MPVKDVYCWNQNGMDLLVSGGYDGIVKFW